jgi:serine/threonine protein kinase
MDTISRKALAPETRLRSGRYRTTELIGQGGFSFVYRATKSDGTIVAIKELFPLEASRKSFFGLWTRKAVRKTADWAELARRTRDEFATVEAMRHPNIVRVHEMFEENGTIYIVMEFLPGKTLHDHLTHHLTGRKPEQLGGLPEADAVVIGAAMADALAYAHSKGIVHRDVKPSNIMIGDDGRIVLLDFGIAKNFRRSDARSRVGTEAYMAPEQLHGGPQTRAVDIYSLGATIYHTLTGFPPLRAEDRLKKDTLATPAALSPDVSLEASDAVMHALELKPSERPKTVQIFAEELRGVPHALAAQASESETRWNWWRPIAILAILGLLALLIQRSWN